MLLAVAVVALDGCEGGDNTSATHVTLKCAVNKGPFVTVSTVNVSPVNDAGNPTGDVYTTQTHNDLGKFSVELKHKAK